MNKNSKIISKVFTKDTFNIKSLFEIKKIFEALNDKTKNVLVID